jgi:hypothetical protein
MTPDEINRAIAEHVGNPHITTKCHECGGCGECGGEADAYHCPECKGTGECRPRYVGPPYSSSLDALHEALQSLTELELFRYADEVCDLTCDSNHDTDIQTMLMLSARELAECYVRAIGKWRVG